MKEKYLLISKLMAVFITMYLIYLYNISPITFPFIIFVILLFFQEKINKLFQEILLIISFGVNFFAIVFLSFIIINLPINTKDIEIPYKEKIMSENNFIRVKKELATIDKYRNEDILNKIKQSNYDEIVLDYITKSSKDRERLIELINVSNLEFPSKIIGKEEKYEGFGNIIILTRYEIVEVDILLKKGKIKEANEKIIRLLKMSEKLSEFRNIMLINTINYTVIDIITDYYMSNRMVLKNDELFCYYLDKISIRLNSAFQDALEVELAISSGILKTLDLKTTIKKNENYFSGETLLEGLIKWPFLDKRRTIEKFKNYYEITKELANMKYYESGMKRKEIKEIPSVKNIDFLHNPIGNILAAISSPIFEKQYWKKERIISKIIAINYIIKKKNEVPIDRLTGNPFIIDKGYLKSEYIEDNRNTFVIKI